ncbi:hypothetical protein [Sphingobacterium ginsenosidimutans]|uniref:Uncharacterized protein n=1 Tax=Sphingobacterium ginsenosidimutans TaxID=687845 RepID=A0ABP8A1N2_9SPHI
MNKIISKIGNVLQLVLAAPIKLPGKTLNIVRYIALGLGIIESVINEKDDETTDSEKINHKSQLDKTNTSAAMAMRNNKVKMDFPPQKGGADENQ